MDRILIYRVGYVVAFLLISLPVSAYYHGHTSGGMVLVGFLLMLILIPLAKVLFYLFMALITNKWTWIIGVVSALYIERRYFLFVTYLIISRYRKTQT